MRGLQIRNWNVRVAGLQVWNLALQRLSASFSTASATATQDASEKELQDGGISRGPILSRDLGTLCRQGNLKEAFKIFDNMDKESTQTSVDIYGDLLQGCAKSKSLEIGKRVHARMIDNGLQENVVLKNLLITMYSKCGKVEDARRVFDTMPKRNVIAWTGILSGMAEEGKLDVALQYLSEMQKEGVKPDAVLYISLLNAVTKSKDINHGKLIHDQIAQMGFEKNLHVANALISMYARCGSVQEAQGIFDKMPERDIVSFTALLNLYCRLGYLSHAQELFDLMPLRDVVSWSAMISGHARHGRSEDGFAAFRKMQEEGLKPDKVTFLTILSACNHPKFLERGKQIHAQITMARFDSDVRLGNALVKMYTQCGRLEEAQQVFDKLARKDMISWTALLNSYIKFKKVKEARDIFDKMPKRDIICWNSMISGYAKVGDGEKALELLHQMEKERVVPDCMTYVVLLNACARIRSLPKAIDFHSRVLISGFEGDLYVQNAVIDMYIKCGSMETAKQIFEKMPRRDVVSWNSLLFGLVHSGQRREALDLFVRMRDDSTTRPDGLTFLAVLSACKKEGLFVEASIYFDMMKRDYKIKPTWKHYSLLSKDGVPFKSQLTPKSNVGSDCESSSSSSGSSSSAATEGGSDCLVPPEVAKTITAGAEKSSDASPSKNMSTETITQ